MKCSKMIVLLVLGWSPYCLAHPTTAAPGPAAAFDHRSAPDQRGYSYAPEAGYRPPPDSREAEGEPISSAWVLRAGAVMGRGYASYSCSGSACTESPVDDNYDQHPGAFVGLDLLAPVSPSVRLGGAWSLMPDTSIEDEADTTELGTQSTLSFLVEPTLSVSKKMSVAIRGQVGLVLLWPGGEVDEARDSIEEACDEYGTEYDECEVDSVPFTGVQASAGPGLRLHSNGVTWRIDLLAQAYRITTLHMVVANNGQELESEVIFQGIRGALTVGVEL